MSLIEDRLKASLAFDVINGGSGERAVFERQVQEAIRELQRLRSESATALHRAREEGRREERRRCAGVARETGRKDETPTWCGQAIANDIARRIESPDAGREGK